MPPELRGRVRVLDSCGRRASHRLQPGGDHRDDRRFRDHRGIELAIIDAKTNVRDFQQTLRNNEVYYALSKGWTICDLPQAMKLSKALLLTAAGILGGIATVSAAAKVVVDVNRPAHAVPATLWGVFFEDINLSADGGVYPEQVRNRSFEDADKLENWTFANVGAGKSESAIDTSRPLNPLNKRSLRVKLDGGFTLENGGYYGMGIAKGESYTFKVALRGDDFTGPVTVKILNAADQELASGEIKAIGSGWKYQSLDLTASGSEAKAKLQISASGKGTLFLDMVSLLPKRTWKSNGLRPDLAEAVDALKPSFYRFPGRVLGGGRRHGPDVQLEENHRQY
jgi:hypothetical protein